MATKTVRKVVKIDADKCNGCGLCVPKCMEGAIQIVGGKARLVGENLCDGLGNCLGHCPQDAITIEERPADDFSEQAVHDHLQKTAAKKPAEPVKTRNDPAPLLCGCPGTMLRQLKAKHPAACPTASAAAPRQSRLGQWPVQLTLLPTSGPIWQNADVLIAADCVAYALADFHDRLLAGKTLAIACPKLDDVGPYIDKLATIFAGNSVRSITVAHMEVPCCTGIVYAVREAIERAGTDIPVTDITVGIDGDVRER